MIYVTMTDTFLSDWGKAKGKIAKYVISCKNEKEADIVAKNARSRGEMRNVQIVQKRPVYDKKRYQTTYATRKTAPNWFRPNLGRK